jgi:DNA-directed RNA polymerase specialized sigma subunit
MAVAIGVESPERERLILQAQGDGPEAEEARGNLIIQEHSRICAIASNLGVQPQDMQDGLQSGYVGFIRAVKRFQLGHGAKLFTYARPFVIGQIRDDIFGGPIQYFRPRDVDFGEEFVVDIGNLADPQTEYTSIVDVVAQRVTLSGVFAVLTKRERQLVLALANGFNQTQAGRLLGMNPMAVSRARRTITRKAHEVESSTTAALHAQTGFNRTSAATKAA